MKEYEQKIRETLIIDESSPSGLRWSQFAAKKVKNSHAGSLDKRGYWRINVTSNGKGRTIFAHRLVWFLSHGVWPKEQIDHINGDKSDNRILNLRDVSRIENGQNRSMQKNNSSGVKGVHFDKIRGKWKAQLRNGREKIYLGMFVNLADAEMAIMAAREKLHGKFANHGIDTSLPSA